MVYDLSRKNETAKRLKALRENYEGKKLSYQKLFELLNKNYYKSENGEILRRTKPDETEDWRNNPVISVGVLKNYELTTDKQIYSDRHKAGFGMNISYLVMFADFYDVSVQYLLGLGNFPSPNEDEQTVNKITGLNSAAIKTLTHLKNTHTDAIIGLKEVSMSNLINKFLTNSYFKTVLLSLDNFITGIDITTTTHNKNPKFSKKQYTMALATYYQTYIHFAHLWIDDIANSLIAGSSFNINEALCLRGTDEYWNYLNTLTDKTGIELHNANSVINEESQSYCMEDETHGQHNKD